MQVKNVPQQDTHQAVLTPIYHLSSDMLKGHLTFADTDPTKHYLLTHLEMLWSFPHPLGFLRKPELVTPKEIFHIQTSKHKLN